MSYAPTVKIENTEFVRDMNTQAVLNTDASSLHRYKESRRRAVAQKKESLEVKERLASIEDEMLALKKIISELTTLKNRG